MRELKLSNIFITIILVLAAIFQFGFLSVLLPQGISVNIILLLTVLLLLEGGQEDKWWLVIAGGVLLDLFSPLPFGIMTVLLSLVAALVYFVHIRFFTNQSVYTITFLGLIASLLFRSLLLVVGYLAKAGGYKYDYMSNMWQIGLLYSLFIDLVLLVLFFIVYALFKKKI